MSRLASIPIHVISVISLWSVLFTGPVLGQTFATRSTVFEPQYTPGARISAVSLADFNGDGRLDIYMPGYLYRQEEDGSFRNVLRSVGIDFEGPNPKGAVFGDANLDGLLDLVVLDSKPGSNLFLNKTGGKFEIGNIPANLQITSGLQGGFWRDLSGDGWLDFAGVVQNGNHLLHTGLANGRFTEQGQFYNLRSNGNTCSLSPGDYDNDGDPDVYVNGCTVPNMLLNLTNGFRTRFQDRAAGANVASNRKSLESAWLDFNNDGWMDLVVANQFVELFNYAENLLYRNEGNGRFTDVAADAGMLGIRRTGYNGPLAVADFDNDGWEDIYLPGNTIGSLFRNNQDGTFTDVYESAFGFILSPSAVAVGDFNNDGWMDIFNPDHGVLYNNPGENNWVTFEVKEDVQNRFGVGATLRLTAGGITQTRVIEAGSGGLGHGNKLKAHFGLGSTTTIDLLEIDWPAHPSEFYSNVDINTHHVFVQGIGPNTPPTPFSQLLPTSASFIDPSVDTIQFEWQPSLDDDPISYTLSITGQAVSLSFPNIDSTAFELSTSLLLPNRIYEWSVTATDQHTVRYSGEERIFSFGQPGNVVSFFEPPVLYDFGLPEVTNGVARFADIDLDGDLDLLFGGEGKDNSILSLYRTENQLHSIPGSNGGVYVFKSLQPSGISLEAMQYPKVSFGDFNGDQFLDIAVNGISAQSGAPKTNIYINVEDSYVLLATNLERVWGGAVEWGDYDNDGDDDLLIAGARNLEAPFDPVTTIYNNNGAGFFVRTSIELPGIMLGDVSWADIDGDGDLDVALTGDQGDGHFISAIFRNDDGAFTDIGANLPALVTGTVSWADFDLDGDQDLLLTGGRMSPELFQGTSILFVNNNGSFDEHPYPFNGVLSGASAWGDYEQDGDPDLFITGNTNPFGPPVTRLFRNDAGQFAPELELPGITNASVAFGDYNGDGDIDFVTIGIDEEGNIRVSFYINRQVSELVPGL